jgi:ribonuclease HI
MKKITIFTDGGSRGNPGPAAVGAQIVDGDGKVLREVSETIGNATNNYAEYMAVVRGLQTAKDLLGKASKETAI